MFVTLFEADMRIQPILKNNHINNFNRFSAQLERKAKIRKCHQYTGVASADLAYASMFDNQIARDLKLMGLI